MVQCFEGEAYKLGGKQDTQDLISQLPFSC